MSSAADNLTEAMTDGRVPFSEDDLANKFSAVHVNDLRYCAAWNRWFMWDGSVWRPDVTVRVFGLAREVCSHAAGLCNEPSKKIASAATIAAVERLARSDLRHATLPEDWDAAQFLLNTPGCVVDLRTSETRPNQPDDMMTKQTAVTPGGECPLWHSFLARVTDNNEQLQAFLQRMAGYMLTGSTKDHALFFAHGPGANGKTVLVTTLSRIWNDYTTAAPMEMFMKSRNDRHPTELAGLRGARLVTAAETEEGRWWAESRIKALTGGDPIAARFMHCDFFTFTPVFKLLISGNNRPRLRKIDEAMRRRLHLIPFNVVIPPAERDPDLPAKLKAEWSGILAWAIEGAVAWHEGGLQPPEIVRTATEEYLSSEDLILTWIEDRCHKENIAETPSSKLWASFREWAESTGERPGAQRTFSLALEGHGYRKDKNRAGAYFIGLRL